MPAAPALRGYRYSPRVLAKVVERFGIDSPVKLLRTAVAHDNGNHYLNRKEITAAAESMKDMSLRGYRWSPNVLNAVMLGAGITDPEQLLAEAVKHDDGNKYLKRSELTEAAGAIGEPEIAYVSDLDKTIIPPHSGGLPDAPYPGVKALLTALETGDGTGVLGDAYYVTARTPDYMDGVQTWLTDNELPAGSIDTGVSGIPWVAEKEKVKDISAILDAHPNQTFVLFGDSSHRDPEVFKKITAKYPGRIAAAVVNRVNNVNPNRVSGLDPIDNYAEAAAILFKRGMISEDAARGVMQTAKAEGLAITNSEIDALLAAE